MKPTDVIKKMGSTGLIATCNPLNESSTVNVIKAAHKGGVRVFELSHHREDRSFDLFEKISEVADTFPQLVLGAGGIANAATTEKYLRSGAQFIISPFMKPEMAAACADYGKLWIPGCSNMKEIEKAIALGARVVKVLPAQLLGLSFFDQVNRNFPQLQLIPSCGLKGKEIELLKWFQTEILCIRMTHELISKERVALKDWAGIEFKVFSIIQRIKKIRQSLNTFADERMTGSKI